MNTINSDNDSIDYFNKVILAPMVRIGTLPMRLLAIKMGAHLVYTEEIIDYKLIRCKRIVNQVLSTIDFVDDDGVVVLRTCPHERNHLIVQLGTSDPKRALMAAKLVEEDVSGVDVNMGCPKQFSMKGGMGASLLTQPEKITKILTTLVQNIRKPISCKIRVLSSVEDSVNLAKLIESTGVKALAVHGRTKDERPQHRNRNETIRAIAECLSICTIANGGSAHINKYSDIDLFRRQTGVTSVMIARSAQRNCSIFCDKSDLMPIDDVIVEYLKLAIEFDNSAMNTKYCVQQMLGSLQESERGKALLAAQHMSVICKLWHLQDFYAKKQLLFKQLKEQQFNVSDDSKFYFVKRRKLKTEGQEKIELPLIFMRSLFDENDLPKSILFAWTSGKHIKAPEYRTTQIEKHFYTVVFVDGNYYSSCYLEKNKKCAEQAAALVAVYSLNLIKDYEIVKQCYVKVSNCVKVLTENQTLYIKTL